MRPPPRSLPLTGLFLAGLAIPGVTAAAELKFAPYAESGVRYDSNLFRASDRAEVIQRTGENKPDDASLRGAAGFDLTWPMSRQRLEASAEFAGIAYDHYDQFNHPEFDLGAAFHYEVGSRISGTARHDRSRTLDDFADREDISRNFLNLQDSEVELLLALGPSWGLMGTVGNMELTNSLASQRRFDRREIREGAELQLATAPGSILLVGAELTQGLFPNRAADDPLSRRFDQTFAYGGFDLNFSKVSRLRARAGYTQRDARDQGDFSGFAGRIAYQRSPSVLTRWDFELFRNVVSVDKVDAIAATSTGGRVRLAWAYSRNGRLTFGYTHRRQDFEQPPDAEERQRRDRTNEAGAEWQYQFRRYWALTMDVAGIERGSTRAGGAYEGLRAGMALRYTLNPD